MAFPIAHVYNHDHEIDTWEFFDSVVYCDEEDTEEWEDFLRDVSLYAAECEDGSSSTRFADFMRDKGYQDQIDDILYDAMKAFTNERILESKADFELC